MATTAAGAMSFAGLSTGLNTDALISAILNQEGKSVQTMTAQTNANNSRTTALQSIESNMKDLSTSMATLQDQFAARSVTSSDVNNAYVTATASGATPGNYDINVKSVATRGRISPTMVAGVAQNLSVADPGTPIFTSTNASFAVQGTDGVLKTFQLNNNSLNGLRDAINGSGAGVTASIVNTGSGTNPYELVVTAVDTGTGKTGGIVSLASIANSDGTASVVNPSLGITAGVVNPDGGGNQGSDAFSNPTTLTGGIQSAAATDAVFTLNDITLTRKSNTVTDAVEGMTISLKAGNQTGNTTLSVVQNTLMAQSGLQDVVSKFNALLTTYNQDIAPSTDANGVTTQGVLAQDSVSRTVINNMRSALTGALDGPTSATSYTRAASLGLKTLADGTLYLDTSVFQAAMTKNPNAAQLLLGTFSGTSTNGVVQVTGGTGKTATGSVTFNITGYTPGGAVTGSFSGTDAQGNAFSNLVLSGSNGTIIGATGTPLEGLSLTVTGAGSGTLALTRGIGEKVQDAVNLMTNATGILPTVLANITNQNKILATEIDSGQAALDRRKTQLQDQYSKMETLIGQMKASNGTLSGLA